ncbi:hypothetical protein AB5J62_35905 [Amycolatopsis sp. cg5]|uniref:hypothetical protein n=1 Tax=Amycolatopsis sp. cg5 TaxID=3238802 RepID=UPI003526BF97
MFVGRSSLLNLIDELTAAPPPGLARPVLVVEGPGGSGRSALLATAHERARERIPAVVVDPLRTGGAPRPVLTAIMLGLSLRYAIPFRRVMVAQVAIKQNFTGLSPNEAVGELREKLQAHRGSTALATLLTDLAPVASALAANMSLPGTAALVDVVTRRLTRGWPSPAWRRAERWFSHQDQGFSLDHEHALIQLSDQAANPRFDVEVDELLVTALLADLREGLARSNALVLLDGGDTDAALSFIRALLRVRRALQAMPGMKQDDPLTVVTTSDGSLAAALDGQVPSPTRWPGSDLTGSWLLATLGDLPENEVQQLAKNRLWAGHGANAIGSAVHRLTGGHCASTTLVLEKLYDEPGLVERLDKLLDRPSPERGATVERYLLRSFAAGLPAHKYDTEDLLRGLITVSAARNLLEAESLAELLPRPLDLEAPLFVSRTLWSPGETSAQQHLHPLARYLGLRALNRRKDPGTCYEAVFRRLLEKTGSDDRAGRLHHERMLGNHADVARELGELLPKLPAEEWLDLLDAIVASPDPRERDIDVLRGVRLAHDRTGQIGVLLGAVPAAEHDPCFADKAADVLCMHISHSYRELAADARDATPFILRSRRYSMGRTWS